MSEDGGGIHHSFQRMERLQHRRPPGTALFCTTALGGPAAAAAFRGCFVRVLVCLARCPAGGNPLRPQKFTKNQHHHEPEL
jgi:hypothetical protein